MSPNGDIRTYIGRIEKGENAMKSTLKIALILILAVLLLLIVGCNKQEVQPSSAATVPTMINPSLVRPPEPNSEASYTEPGSGGSSQASVLKIQYLPETVEQSDGRAVLKWVCLLDGGIGGMRRTWAQEAADDVNQMLKQKNMPFQIQFVLVSSDEYLYNFDWFSRTEVQYLLTDADLVTGYMDAEEMKTYLAPVTEHTAAGGALENAVPHPYYWLKASVDGTVYGFPIDAIPAYSEGWNVSKELMTRARLTEQDFLKPFWGMDEVFADLFAANDNQPFIYLSSDTASYTKDSGINELAPAYLPYELYNRLQLNRIGSCYAVDYSENTPRVVNYLETEAVRNYQQAMLRYKEAGYVSSDFMQGLVKYSMYPDWRDGFVHISLGDYLYYAVESDGYVTGIGANCVNREAVITFLQLIAEDKEFQMQMFFGEEGRDYEVKDGCYKLLKREDGSDYSMDFLSPWSYFCGLSQDSESGSSRSPATFGNWQLAGNTGEEKLQLHIEVLNKAKTVVPNNFDFAGFEQTVADLEWNFRRYFPYFFYGRVYQGVNYPALTPEIYDLMLYDLEQAGAKDLEKELQFQLDEWLEKNP